MGFGRDEIAIGCTPAGEECEQLGPNYRPERARQECSEFIKQLRRQLGDEPQGARLRVKANEHDFGTYLEVVCVYDIDSEAAAEYAYKCEAEMPEFWDAPACEALGITSNALKV